MAGDRRSAASAPPVRIVVVLFIVSLLWFAVESTAARHCRRRASSESGHDSRVLLPQGSTRGATVFRRCPTRGGGPLPSRSTTHQCSGRLQVREGEVPVREVVDECLHVLRALVAVV